jgi:hypothetical protein
MLSIDLLGRYMAEAGPILERWCSAKRQSRFGTADLNARGTSVVRGLPQKRADGVCPT